MLQAGKVGGRRSEEERILCLNLGLAVEDMACAFPLHRRARESGAGTRLEL